ncbi:hypothetical protein ACS15_2179 [Ralstonia insidiosa]|uniref:Uncharacterized protein n=1 Tax=Ralstonia insidiosa TaxID=190721 RepID=A0AAC9FSA6_9RALS|nr:hypothetical protein ACS15_2179 [Ralstonia insidiosa]
MHRRKMREGPEWAARHKEGETGGGGTGRANARGNRFGAILAQRWQASRRKIASVVPGRRDALRAAVEYRLTGGYPGTR